MKLGKKNARHAISLKFGDFFDPSQLPHAPAVFGHASKVSRFYGLGNDVYSNCVFAGAAHEHQIWTVAGGWDRARFTTKDTLLDYSAVTGFDPTRPETDRGTDMQEAASYRRRVGIRDAENVRHKIDSYVALRTANFEQMRLAMWLMGAVGIGLSMPAQAMDQFDRREVWTVPSKPIIEGGHYVPGVGMDPAGNIQFISWGRVLTMTPAFYERFSDEAVAYISLELLNAKKLSPDGFDADGLRQSMQKLSS